MIAVNMENFAEHLWNEGFEAGKTIGKGQMFTYEHRNPFGDIYRTTRYLVAPNGVIRTVIEPDVVNPSKMVMLKDPMRTYDEYEITNGRVSRKWKPVY